MTITAMLEHNYTLDQIMAHHRKVVIAKVMTEERTKRRCGHIGRSAERLGIHRNTLDRMLRNERDPPISKKEIDRTEADSWAYGEELEYKAMNFAGDKR